MNVHIIKYFVFMVSGLEFDPTHDEEFAYEMYKTDKYIVGV